MQNPTKASLSKIHIPELTPADQEGLQDYWSVYESHWEEIDAELLQMAANHPELQFILNNPARQPTVEEREDSLERQRRAFLQGEWKPYLDNLQAQGFLYAKAGVSFQTWFEIVAAFRKHIMPYLLGAYGKSPKQLLSAITSVDMVIDIAMSVVGESYLETKEQLIQQQNEELEARVAERTHLLEQANQELEQSQKDTQGILDSMATLNAKVALDGTLLFVNKSARQAAGLPEEELMKTNFLEGRWWTFDPQVQARVKEAFAQACAGTPVSYDEKILVFDQVLTISFSLTPLLGSHDRVEYILAEGRDITRLKQLEERFRSLLESAPDAIVIVDEAGQITLINSQTEKLFGYEPAEIIGKGIELLVPKRFRKKHVKHRQGYYVEHPVRPMGVGLDLFGLRKNGNEFPIEISLSPLETEEGLLVSAAIWDITKRKQDEADIQKLNDDLRQRAGQLEAANKELEAFSYSVSHDLRAPLRSIDGFSHALLDDYGEQIPPEGREYLERVRAATRRMAVLIDDLLNLSCVTRWQSGRVLPISVKWSQRSWNSLQESQPERQVETSIASDLMVECDPQLMHIVLENLLSNAWKFTSKQERAIIEFGQQEKMAERKFYIRDNGAGFNMAYADKLFGVFQRLHGATEFPGTGVGLATVQRIITMHGGHIWARSEEGKGATFYFTL